MNAVEIEQAISDLALQPFDAAEFPFAFLAAFGNKDTTLRRLRAGNNNASDVPGGMLQRNNIHLAVCQPATTGAGLHALRSSPATAKGKAKFILAADGQTLEAEDLTAGETIACDYPGFPDLYDPEAMPENLRQAYERNDEVLERTYIGRRFKNDTERLEKLFALYTQMTAAPKAPAKKAVARTIAARAKV